MRIREKPDASEFLLIPANEEEQELMARIAAELAAGQAVNYDGRCADPDDSEYTCVKLYIGGRREEVVTQVAEGFKWTSHEYVGGVLLLLKGEEEQDKGLVWNIRNMYFFGTAALLYLGETAMDGQAAYRFTGCRCKLCGAVTVYRHCEHKICKACAEKCSHEWTKGHVHGSGVDVALGTYCKICGVVDEATHRKLQTVSLSNLHSEAVAYGGVFDAVLDLP